LRVARSSTSFKKGTAKPEGSGRKKGQPNKVVTDVRELAQGYGPEAIATLVDLMRDADFETVRVSAAKELLDRAYGKAIQPVDATIVHNIVYEVVLDFGDPAQVLQGNPEVPPTIQGPARNGKALVHNGRSS
jgi:hypothetical protein